MHEGLFESPYSFANTPKSSGDKGCMRLAHSLMSMIEGWSLSWEKVGLQRWWGRPECGVECHVEGRLASRGWPIMVGYKSGSVLVNN